VPVPAAAWLFGSGLIGLVAVSRRKKSEGASLSAHHKTKSLRMEYLS
jgi:hypothetical protein